jgi:hypothetical protein
MVKLMDGSQVEFDWRAITQKEWNTLKAAKATDNDIIDPLCAKLVGMTVDELTDLNPIDFMRVEQGMFENYKELVDTSTVKNSEGASSKP